MNNARAAPSFPPPISTTLARWQAAARAVTAAELLGDAKSLGIIVPHADDETLGCGGLIAEAARRGVAITVTILTDGAASHPGSAQWPPPRLAAQRRIEARAAVAILAGDAARVVFADAPDGQLAAHPQVAQAVPDAALFVTCWRGDPHPDHRAAYDTARVVARRCAAPLLAFPLWTLTTAAPAPRRPLLHLDVTGHFPAKQAALDAYASQLGRLISDAPGFVLDPALQHLFLRPDELFIDALLPATGPCQIAKA